LEDDKLKGEGKRRENQKGAIDITIKTIPFYFNKAETTWGKQG